MSHARVALAVLAVLAVLATGACGGDSQSGRTSGPMPTRPAAGLPTATTHPPSPTEERRSQPYWVPVASFRGDGPLTTAPFTIDPGALQWRATWHCQSGPFDAVVVTESGQDLVRKVVDGSSCPTPELGSTGFSRERGRFTMRVTAAGPWRIDIEQNVDVPLIEPPPPGVESAELLGTATIYDVDRDGEGTARIYELPDGQRVIRLEDFYVSINSDLEIRLSELPSPKTTAQIASAPFRDVAFLKATVGSMNYPVPPDVDLSRYKSIVIWCEITFNAYAAGALQTTE